MCYMCGESENMRQTQSSTTQKNRIKRHTKSMNLTSTREKNKLYTKVGNILQN